jgi:hypothetical protein
MDTADMTNRGPADARQDPGYDAWLVGFVPLVGNGSLPLRQIVGLPNVVIVGVSLLAIWRAAAAGWPESDAINGQALNYAAFTCKPNSDIR